MRQKRKTFPTSLYYSRISPHIFPTEGGIFVKKHLRVILLTLLLLCALWLLTDTSVRTSVSSALILCARSVIPALFPFMVVSSLLISLGLGELLSGPLGGLMALYGIGGAGASALVLGLIGGYPTGGRTAAALYREGLVTRDEAERLLAFCNNANPAFLITALGVGVFGSFRAGLWLWLIHIAAALLSGLLAARPRRGASCSAPQNRTSFRAAGFSSVFVSAVQGALGSILSVCAFVVVFSILSQPLRRLGGIAGTVGTGALELFSVLPLLTPDPTGFILAAGISGWGSLSVLCQTAALMAGTGLSLRRCALGKAVQSVLSMLLAALCSGFVFPR